jgi:hypothetical protein
MKRILSLLFLTTFLVNAYDSGAQTPLVKNQNPQYMESQAKYMNIADSVNGWHSSTIHDTYKAIDYLADKKEARDQRKAFRRELRLERARYGYGWNNDNYYPSYYNRYSNYRYYPMYNRPYRNNYFWNTLPLAFALGWCWR